MKKAQEGQRIDGFQRSSCSKHSRGDPAEERLVAPEEQLTSSLLCGMVPKNSKPATGTKLTKRDLAGPRTLKPKVVTNRKQSCLLLREAEAHFSFSDSSKEESFDQGY